MDCAQMKSLILEISNIKMKGNRGLLSTNNGLGGSRSLPLKQDLNLFCLQDELFAAVNRNKRCDVDSGKIMPANYL